MVTACGNLICLISWPRLQPASSWSFLLRITLLGTSSRKSSYSKFKLLARPATASIFLTKYGMIMHSSHSLPPSSCQTSKTKFAASPPRRPSTSRGFRSRSYMSRIRSCSNRSTLSPHVFMWLQSTVLANLSRLQPTATQTPGALRCARSCSATSRSWERYSANAISLSTLQATLRAYVWLDSVIWASSSQHSMKSYSKPGFISKPVSSSSQMALTSSAPASTSAALVAFLKKQRISLFRLLKSLANTDCYVFLSF